MTHWADIERKWQDIWEDRHTFEAEPDGRPKKMITVAYPYPNSPQHIGHGRTYTLADIDARFWRMRGYNVLFPMGFHYTGTPILGMARRVQAGDAELLGGLRHIFGVPDDVIEGFDHPLNIANYFRDEIRQGMREMGYSIDWRRQFTTIDEPYKKLIEWQITRLRALGLIIQGSHPVGWCPRDQNPVSQHDTLGDVEPEFTEYTLIKFTWGDRTIPTATLRPETIFGVTNIWVNPHTTYDIIDAGGELWVVSPECSAKLSLQGRTIKKVDTIRGMDIVGQQVRTPLGNMIPVLPAAFADPNTGTGVVMSVPAHAPFDYQALQDLAASGHTMAAGIQPIPIISVPGFGDIPARDICEAMAIRDQKDSRLEEATTQVYNKEFYMGVLTEGCGRFAGQKVSESKDMIREWLHNTETLHEMAGEVRCRCGAICVVKMLTNQWFLNYGDEQWKAGTKECLKGMGILPPEISSEFHNVVDWLRERACARQQGMGTSLPWDDNWIVESLSDSTIYMAFYIIMKFVQNHTITADMMDKRFFDYVLLGQGGRPDIPYIDEIREEFLYYYPVDTRHSGRDLVPNHLTFFVMNHVALFPPQHWPRQVVVNGSVLMGGKKMSKSMGNIVPLRQAIARHGADPIRLGIVISAELLQDADINLESVAGIGARLESIISECRAARPHKGYAGGTSMEDAWLEARLGAIIQRATCNMERMRLREALHDILYGFESDLQWYNRRVRAAGRSMPPGMSYDICRVRAALLAPFAPHAAEEMWEDLGMDGLVSEADWPDYTGDGGPVIHMEHLLKTILEDISKIVRMSGITPNRISVYVAGSAEAYRAVLRCVVEGKTSMRDIMRDIIKDEETAHLRSTPELVARCLKDILSEPAHIREARLADGRFDERSLIESELERVTRIEFDAPVAVYGADDMDIRDPGNKARFARPCKPAIFIE